MKYLVVGLGNIGPEYVGTRHNIGFDILDHIARAKEAEWKSVRLGDMTQVRHRGRIYELLKPSTYMNGSGRAVKYWLTQLKLPLDRLLVVVDDLNLPPGKLRIRKKGSAGGHNGLTDIEQSLGTAAYYRLRFGIGSEFSKGAQVDFVLGPWEAEEKPMLEKRIDIASKAILDLGQQGIDRIMERYNKA